MFTLGDEAVIKIKKLIFSDIPIYYQEIVHFLLYLQKYKEFEGDISDLQIEKI